MSQLRGNEGAISPALGWPSAGLIAPGDFVTELEHDTEKSAIVATVLLVKSRGKPETTERRDSPSIGDQHLPLPLCVAESPPPAP
jgi:hypothetical protein